VRNDHDTSVNPSAITATVMWLSAIYRFATTPVLEFVCTLNFKWVYLLSNLFKEAETLISTLLTHNFLPSKLSQATALVPVG
jgi:hypothetical protein